MSDTSRNPSSSLWIFEAASSALFALGIAYLLFSGQYLRFVTPRMAWCLYVLVAFFLAWGIDLAVQKPEVTAKGIVSKCLVVLIPALLILVPHSAITGSSFDKFGGNQPIQLRFVADSGANKGKPITLNSDSSNAPGLNVKAKTITISNANFGAWYDLLQSSPEQFAGYTVTMTGFVHRVPTTLGANQFLISRPLMTCCIEDISAFGIPAEYAQQSSLTENSWVSVSGTLGTTHSKVNGASTPLLKITSVKTALQVTGYFYR